MAKDGFPLVIFHQFLVNCGQKCPHEGVFSSITGYFLMHPVIISKEMPTFAGDRYPKNRQLNQMLLKTTGQVVVAKEGVRITINPSVAIPSIAEYMWSINNTEKSI